MIKFLPLILTLAYGLVMMRLSVWQTRRHLEQASVPLQDAGLDPFLRRFAKALDLPQIRVRLYEQGAVNALAGPDGQVYLTRGLYEAYRRGALAGDEVASVIGHELGHVALGHLRRRMIDFTGRNAAFVMLTMVLGRFVPLIGPWIASLLSGLVMAGLSRRDEFEADEYCSALMIKAGLGTGAQKRMFGKLPGLTGGAAEASAAWLRSHPTPQERIRAIEANEQRWGLAGD